MADVVIDVIAKDSFSGVLGNFGNIMTGINSVVNLAAGAFRTFTDWAQQGLDAVAFFERLSLTLETLSARELLVSGQAETMAQALEMSAGAAEELQNWMIQVAIKSPFTTEGVATAFRMAQAYGFTADESKRLVQALIDFTAGSGQNEDAMQRIALAMGQIQAKGKLAGQEVLQLANAGIPIQQILAESMGITTAEVVALQREGLIPAQQALEALTVYLETNFAGAAERQATSWAGLQNTFADLKQLGLKAFFEGLYTALQPLAIELSNFIQGPGLEILTVLGTGLGELAGTIFEKYEGFSQSPFMLWIEDLIDRATVVDEKIVGFVDRLHGVQENLQTEGPIIELVKTVDTDLFFENMKADIKDALYDAFISADWGAISDAIVESIDKIDWTPIGVSFGEGLKVALGIAGDKISEVNWFELLFAPIKAAGEFLAGWFAGFWGIEVSGSFEEALAQWGGFFEGLGNSITGWFTGIADGISDWWESIKTEFINIIVSIQSFATGVVDAVSGFIANSINSIIDTVSNIVGNIFDWLGIDQEEFIAQWQDIFSSISEIVSFLVSSLVESLSGIWDSIVESLSNVWDDIVISFNTLVDSLSNALAPVAGMLLSIWNPVKEATTSAFNTVKNIVTDAWEYVTDWINFQLDKIRTSIANKIQDALVQVGLKVVGFYLIGKDLVQGLIDGIGETIGGLAQSVTTGFQDFLNKVKEFFGISSPSSVFFDIGKNIVQGLIDGVLSLTSRIAEVIGNLFKPLWPFIEPILNAFGIDLGDISFPTNTETGTGTPATGGTVTNNYYFYGTVYMSGVGPEGSYDCVPNPVISAGSQTVTAPGF